MKITIEAEPKEIAALVLEIQGRQNVDVKFVPETSEGPCDPSDPKVKSHSIPFK
jgi:hypothetical protein